MSDYPMLISNKLHSFRNFIDANILFIVASLSFSFGYIIFFYGIDSFFGYDP